MEGLGINWKILIGQIVNFIILLYLLKRFAFKPFLNMLEKRKNSIVEGVRKSEEAEKSLQKIRVLEGEIRKSGEERTKLIIKEAEEKATAKAREIRSLAEDERKKIIEEARMAAEKETLKEKENQKKEMIDLTFLLTEKFLKEKFNEEKDKKLLEELISEIK